MKWSKTSLFGSAVFITFITEKLIITHREPIEGPKVWILLGYPCNILGYPSKYCNYISKKKLGWFPRPPQWITFLIFISQKILLNIKDEFDFRMGCIHVLFPFLWIINVQFTNFGFLNFRFFYLQNWRYWLTLIQNNHFCHWNIFKTKFKNPNSRRLVLKSPKFNFLPFLAAKKFIAHTNIQIHITGSILIVFLKMLVRMSSIRINNNWNYQKMLIIKLRSP